MKETRNHRRALFASLIALAAMGPLAAGQASPLPEAAPLVTVCIVSPVVDGVPGHVGCGQIAAAPVNGPNADPIADLCVLLGFDANDLSLCPEEEPTYTLIGIDYEHIDHGGASYWWYGTAGGCYNGQEYAVASMPAGWNDVVSSATGYNNCYFEHYEHDNWGGTYVICTFDCPNMVTLNFNDKTSSLWWW